MSKLIRNLIRDESGAAAIEYGLIAGLIAVVIIAGATALGGTLNGMFNTLSTILSAVANQGAHPEKPGPQPLDLARRPAGWRVGGSLGHTADETARIFVLDQCQPDPDVTAAGPRASQILRDFVHAHIAVIDLDEKLHRTLQPDMQTPDTGRLNNDTVVQIPQCRVFEPGHQKSSAEGIRL